ncbi:glucan biosynthesis protein D [Bradyrhizobium sp. CCBAU 051011]|uniref:glucan biosynthesis protein G n=1 Tax=Bradyrhizobium sp. CCBAU 051011 TaxID=858422 RepID=UPI0013746075|nr:glucan biosynthesis protein G [Bradyrhizobium sp. CCBAU 051011]QHO71951.1 glucan biosynthesis protein D [Bradyrhizobium sp. CCBAU 051011]
MNRRDFLAASALPLVTGVASGLLSTAQAQPAPFDRSIVRQIARDLAGKPYKAPSEKLPDNLANIDYDRYRAIRFLPERALWRGEKLPFEAQFFHRGFFYKNRVDIFEVKDGQAAPIAYRPDLFSFGDLAPPGPAVDLGFAGFRLHAPINKPDYYDEVCVFLGASYFRAVAKGQLYGLSARGLAINTGEAKGEEFPFFKTFWIEKPAPGANSIVVHALLDSESAAAAYRFTIRPGDTTVFDVEMAIYPRVDLQQAGLAPMTSMFFFGPNDRKDVEDFRPSVHDSDGLAVFNGRGEELWRPLHNPRDLQVSSFADLNPRGFGLMQRQRDFAAYQDLESNFERRPSLWAEPIGDWGEGEVKLLEIPTKEEIHDNIALFWRPKAALPAKGEHTYTYRLHWGPGAPKPTSLARFSRTGIGVRGDNAALFVLDVTGERLKSVNPQSLRGVVTAEKAKIQNIVTQPNPATGGWRLSFELVKEKAPVELRASLMQDNEAVSEVWVYRWTP